MNQYYYSSNDPFAQCGPTPEQRLESMEILIRKAGWKLVTNNGYWRKDGYPDWVKLEKAYEIEKEGK